jgi:transcriptional regulator with XRE-family HTH domain
LPAKDSRRRIRWLERRQKAPHLRLLYFVGRNRAGYSVEGAAEKLSIPPNTLSDWESDNGALVPTVKQARNLAALYGRSFLEWFLPATPDLPDPKLIPDFRLYHDAEDHRDTREKLDAQLWAETQRDNALDLYSELGEEVPLIPENLFSTIEGDVDTVAAAVRVATQFPIEQQAGRITTQERAAIPSLIRDKIESLGILTLRRSDLKRYGVRGFCIADFSLPVIVFSTESPNAQAFTLAHELAHVILKQSAISGAISRRGGDEAIRTIENWCNSLLLLS